MDRSDPRWGKLWTPLGPLGQTAPLNFTLAVNFREPLGCAHQVPGPDYIMKPGNFFHCWDASWSVGTAPHPFEIISL